MLTIGSGLSPNDRSSLIVYTFPVLGDELSVGFHISLLWKKNISRGDRDSNEKREDRKGVGVAENEEGGESDQISSMKEW